MISRLENINDSTSPSPIDPELLNATIQAELAHWQNLTFSFDMDEGQRNRSGSSTPGGTGQRSRSASQSHNTQPTDVQDAVLLAQFAAAAGGNQNFLPDANSYAALLHYLQSHPPPSTSSPPYPIGGLPPNLYQNPVPHPHMQPNPALWQQQQAFQPHPHSLPHQHAPSQHMDAFGAGPSGNMHLSNLHLPPLMLPPYNPQVNPSQSNPALSPSLITPSSSSSATRSSAQSQSQASASSPSADDEEVTDVAIAEDKRRRNTAASARFRIKKKMRNLNLERTVSELSGRADTLEREAADLRRENGWLKEIVMLKGSRLAGIDISPHTIPTAESSSQAQARTKTDDQESQSQSEGSSDEYQPGSESKSKRKGKGKEKRK